MKRRNFAGALGALSLLLAVGPEHTLAGGAILRGSFVQERHLSGFNAPLISTGHFILVQGRGLLWRVEQPFAVTTAITPAGLMQQVDGTDSMHLSAAAMPFLSHLYRMLGGALGGDWTGLDTDFTVVRSGDADHWQVLLTPRHPEDSMAMPYASIVASGGRFIETVTLSKPGGDGDILRFADQSLDSGPLPPDDAAALDRAGK